jgi:hypothetical protein
MSSPHACVEARRGQERRRTRRPFQVAPVGASRGGAAQRLWSPLLLPNDYGGTSSHCLLVANRSSSRRRTTIFQISPSALPFPSLSAMAAYVATATSRRAVVVDEAPLVLRNHLTVGSARRRRASSLARTWTRELKACRTYGARSIRAALCTRPYSMTPPPAVAGKPSPRSAMQDTGGRRERNEGTFWPTVAN